VSRRILQVGMEWPSTNPSGVNRYVHDLHVALRAQGADGRALVVGPVRPATAGVQGVSRVDASLPARVAQVARAVRNTKDWADVLDVHFPLYGALPALRAPRGCAVVVHFHGPWGDEARLHDGAGALGVGVRVALQRRVLRRAQLVVVLSEAFRDLVVSSYGVPSARVRVIAPGVDHEWFGPGAGRAAARRALGLQGDAAVVFAARRLVPRIGLDVLLRAWAAGVPPGGLLAIAGEGPEGVRLRGLVADLGVEASVRFLDRVSDEALREWYRAADVSVVPSLALEGFGLVVLESLACGTPVIASRVGGLPETLAALAPDLLVAPGDVGALAAALRGVFTGGAGTPTPEQCRAWAARYDWTTAACATLEVYDEAISLKGERE
jgi:glycosyltransferase involved in cell wall biosynthesis